MEGLHVMLSDRGHDGLRVTELEGKLRTAHRRIDELERTLAAYPMLFRMQTEEKKGRTDIVYKWVKHVEKAEKAGHHLLEACLEDAREQRVPASPDVVTAEGSLSPRPVSPTPPPACMGVEASPQMTSPDRPAYLEGDVFEDFARPVVHGPQQGYSHHNHHHHHPQQPHSHYAEQLDPHIYHNPHAVRSAIEKEKSERLDTMVHLLSAPRVHHVQHAQPATPRDNETPTGPDPLRTLLAKNVENLEEARRE